MFSLHPVLKQRTPTGEVKSRQHHHQQQQQQQQHVESEPMMLRRSSNELSELELEKQRAMLLAQLKEPESE